jgi:hypothetical protein
LKPYLFLFFILISPLLKAQHPYSYNIGTEQDLPSNEVYSIKQDSFGYIWIGSDAGLFRYDGFRFKQYRNERMAGRSISDLKFDTKGNLWCRNFNGQLLCVSGDSLGIMLDYSKDKGMAFSYTFTDDGRLWVASGSKISIFDPTMQLLSELNTENNGDDKKSIILDIAAHKNYIYFFKNLSALYSVNPKSLAIQKIKEVNNQNYSGFLFYSTDKLYCHFEKYENNERVYEIKILEGASLKPIKKFVSGKQSSFLYKMQPIDSDNLWICSSNGAFRIEDADGESLSAKNLILQEQRVSDMLRDREGNYWFTTLQNGIFVIPSLQVMTYSPENFKGLTVPYLTKIRASRDHKLWIGSHSGKVFNLSPVNNEIRSLYDDLYPPYRAVKNFFETEDFLFISRNSNIAVSQKNNKCYQLDVRDARALWLWSDTIFSVTPVRFAKSYPADPSKNFAVFDSTEELSASGGWAMDFDSSMQALWVTLGSGLHYYKNGKLFPVLDQGNPIFAGYLDYEEGILWVSTMNKGLYGFEKGKIKYRFTEKNGLKNNSTKVIKAFSGFVLVTAGNYLHRIALSSGTVEILTKNLGIFAKDIEDIEILNGIVYLATHKGLTTFPLNLDVKNWVKPNIAIEWISLSGNIANFEMLQQLPFRHGQLQIGFISASFRSKGDFYYEYRLLGLENTWNRLDAKNNFVSFSSIPPGKYSFEVRAVNENGIESEAAVVELKILYPIWQQWWFYLLLSIFFALLIIWIYNIRMKVVTKRWQMEQAITGSQLTALKAQMNPHFMYNALNSIQDLILTNDVRNANLYLNKFSSLMRSILKASDSETIQLEEEIAILKLYLDLEKLRFGNDFIYTINFEPSLDLESVSIPSMIIQPFVENAIKHGLLHKKGEKYLEISFVPQKEGLLLCTISDNGVGRKKATEIKDRAMKQHQSFATEATAKRLEILNNRYGSERIGFEIQDLHSEDKKHPLGTKVLLHIPYSL